MFNDVSEAARDSSFLNIIIFCTVIPNYVVQYCKSRFKSLNALCVIYFPEITSIHLTSHIF